MIERPHSEGHRWAQRLITIVVGIFIVWRVRQFCLDFQLGQLACHCDAKRVLAALRNGADVDSEAFKGGTALGCAVHCPDPAVLSILLQHGAEPQEPLRLAALRGREINVRLLISAGADPHRTLIECRQDHIKEPDSFRDVSPRIAFLLSHSQSGKPYPGPLPGE